MEEKKQREDKWRETAAKMIEWFNGRELPPDPIQVTHYSRITNGEKYVATQIAIVQHWMHEPFNRTFNCAYMRLYELKKFIENEQPGTTDRKA